ncbi:hypothetical protein Barb4_01286 [Bacteroidales bacterium Barb4]|nr:hypothetical protein Barb4_01286 [Bacteroidales bacterium Barb4]
MFSIYMVIITAMAGIASNVGFISIYSGLFIIAAVIAGAIVM